MAEIWEAPGFRSASGEPGAIARVSTRSKFFGAGWEARGARGAGRLLGAARRVASGASASSCYCLIRRGPGRAGGGAASAGPPTRLS